ncbi:hypothetical protein ACHAXN_007177 [Cyclotella atomus]
MASYSYDRQLFDLLKSRRPVAPSDPNNDAEVLPAHPTDDPYYTQNYLYQKHLSKVTASEVPTEFDGHLGYGSHVSDQYSIVISRQLADSPEAIILDFGIWMDVHLKLEEKRLRQHPGEYSCEDGKIDCIEKVLGNERMAKIRLGTRRMAKDDVI